MLGTAILLAAVAGFLAYLKTRAPKLPVVSLAAIDPALRSIILSRQSNVVAHPKSGIAWGRLGEGLHAAEFTASAGFCYSNAARLEPSSFRWEYLYGLASLQDNPDLAIEHLDRAAELAAGSTDAPRYQLARALVERGRHAEAVPHLQRVLAKNPAHAAACVELARVHLARGALREATQTLQPALTNSFTMRPALLLAAQIAQRNNQPDAAAQISRRAASMSRPFDWPDPVLRELQTLRLDRARVAEQANAMLQQQRVADAGRLLADLLNAFPNDPEGLLLMGRLRYLQRNCAEAEAMFRRHLSVQTNSLNGLVQLGLSLLCQERWADAASVLEQAVALKPDFAQAHSNLGVAYARLGNSTNAIRAYRNVLRSSPGDINAHMALAEELANIGDIEDAKSHVKRAAALNPNDPRVLAAREQLQMK